jgi:hypothetical protein
MLPLPLPDAEGRRVVLFRSGITIPEEVKIADVFKAQMMVSDIMFEEDDRVIVCGSVNVMDHSHTTLAHMAQFSPSLTKKATTLFQVNMAESTCPLPVKYYFCFKYLISHRQASGDCVFILNSHEFGLLVCSF